jgi:phage terminase Nu1 subunit (DNA packaging protein)
MSSKTHLWKAFDGKRGRFQVWGRRRFTVALTKQYLAWSARFRDAVMAGELMTEFDFPTEPIVEAFNEVYARVGIAFAKEQAEELKSHHGYRVKDVNVTRDYIEAWVARECGQRIVGITSTTQKLMQGIIKRAVDQGLSIDRTQALIRSEFTAMSRLRAERIARTEIVSASNMGSQLAAESTGLTLVKEWLATRDGRTRDDHAEADGQTVGLNEYFVVGGEQMMQPGDPSASASQTINCRCVAVYREP